MMENKELDIPNINEYLNEYFHQWIQRYPEIKRKKRLTKNMTAVEMQNVIIEAIDAHIKVLEAKIAELEAVTQEID